MSIGASPAASLAAFDALPECTCPAFELEADIRVAIAHLARASAAIGSGQLLDHDVHRESFVRAWDEVRG